MRRELAPFSHWIAAERGENNKALRLRLAGHDIGLRAVAITRGGRLVPVVAFTPYCAGSDSPALHFL
jgi:hypothetical protein